MTDRGIHGCIRTLLCTLTLATAALAGEFTEPGTELDQISLFVAVLGPDGTPVRGLPLGGFQVLEDGIQQPITDRREAGSNPPDERRWFVLQFSRQLNFRELFRAKRAALWLLEHLRPQDAIAVLRTPGLSPFSSRPESMRSMLHYFGVEDGLREVHDLPSLLDWHRRLKTDTPTRMPTGEALGELISKGAKGSPTDLVSRLKHLGGRKILVFFAAGLPETADDDLPLSEQVDPSVLGDAGFSLHAVDVRRAAAAPFDSSFRLLKAWATATGGDAFQSHHGPDQGLSALLQRLDAEYWFRYTPSRPPDGRYRGLQVIINSRQALRVLHRPGYFATVPAALPLPERTLLTVMRHPDRFQDFPLNLEGRTTSPRSQTPAELEVALTFPLSAVQLEPSGGSRRQKARLFLTVLDREGRRIGGIDRRLLIRADEAELDSILQQSAAFRETLELDHPHAARLQALVVIGDNVQLAFRQYWLPTGN